MTSQAAETRRTVARGETLLEVEDLTVGFDVDGGRLRAVDGVSFSLKKGEVLAIVGESGSGKSAMAMSLLGLNRGKRAHHAGAIHYHGRNLVALSEAEYRRLRGNEMAMIFQDALASLNPLQPIGDQIVEMIRLHRPVSRSAARQEAVRLLGEVGIPEPRERLDAHPHHFSGGMRQRVMIAMALANDPDVLIADEPTTALDVTIQAQIIDLLKRLRDQRDAAIILITHDLGVVADIADRVAVMYAGQIVEMGPRDSLFATPQHPYSWGLLGSVPRIDRPRRKRMPAIAGTPPSLIDPPRGCRFAERCPQRFARCVEPPPLTPAQGSDHWAACWLDPGTKMNARRAALAGEEEGAP